ncbi:acetyl-CoA C-acetyltransferase [Demequina sp. B12]|uniref:acetyl-CoA C-acetyltransferase n=1 Tax=Demequina sp. B12 TaxID=2992757 RepID=UPI00237BD7AC|nr:acetyl-CoA C-acetyltransferase [Demequina sp. B12]MDE0573132.1 acetyl-CoA C-acetyltransferase [Demequina sp. B12]
MTHNAVVIGGNRIPFTKSGGPYAHASNHDMLTAALDGLIARFGLSGMRMGEVAAGAVLKDPADFNLTREAVLSTTLAPDTPACDLQQACGTGLEATIYIANKIALGQIDVGISGGTDTTSDAPITLSDPMRRVLLEASAARSLGQRVKPFTKVRPRHLSPKAPSVAEPRTGMSMGQHQAKTSEAWAIERSEQDALAVASHHNLAQAWNDGFFDDLVTPYLGVTTDTIMRADTSVEKLAKLPAVFGGPNGTMTAGNSTALSDGAATVLLASEEWARDHHLPVLARIVDAEVSAVDHPGGADLLLGPVAATGRLLARQGLTVSDFDLVEIHEAFASTVLATLKAWADDDYCRSLGLDSALGTIDRDRLNVTGSSLATGHPFAATGARIVPTLAKLLHARGPGTRGLISMCAAGGQGVVAVLEAV